MTHKVRSHHFVPSDLLFSPSCCVQKCVTMNQRYFPRVVYLCMDSLHLFLRQTLNLSHRKQAAATGLTPPLPHRPNLTVWSIDLWINACINLRRTQKGSTDDLEVEISHAKSDCWAQSLSSWFAGPKSNGSIGRLTFSCDCGKEEGLKLLFISLKNVKQWRALVGWLLLCPTSVARPLCCWCWCHYLLLLSQMLFGRIFYTMCKSCTRRCVCDAPPSATCKFPTQVEGIC